MQKEMRIRRATSDDAESLAKVHIDSWRSAYRGLVPHSYLDGLDYAKRGQYFRKALAARSEETYLAEQEGEILGFLTVGRCRDADVDREATGEIFGIYLAPQHWRKGLGSSLCRFAEETLRSRGFRRATLWVFEANDRARRFYEAMGFRADGASKTLHPGAPLKAVRYGKQLANAKPTGEAAGEDNAA